MIVTVELDRERELRFDFNCFSLVEEICGRSALTAAYWGSLSVRDVRLLLWAAALQTDPTVGLLQIGSAIVGPKVAEVAALLERLRGDLSGQGGATAEASAEQPPVNARGETQAVLRAMGAIRAEGAEG